MLVDTFGSRAEAGTLPVAVGGRISAQPNSLPRTSALPPPPADDAETIPRALKLSLELFDDQDGIDRARLRASVDVASGEEDVNIWCPDTMNFGFGSVRKARASTV